MFIAMVVADGAERKHFMCTMQRNTKRFLEIAVNAETSKETWCVLWDPRDLTGPNDTSQVKRYEVCATRQQWSSLWANSRHRNNYIRRYISSARDHTLTITAREQMSAVSRNDAKHYAVKNDN